MRSALVGFTALLAVVWLAVWRWARTPDFSPLRSDERAAVMRVVRAAVDGRGGQNSSADGALGRAFGDVVIAALYDRGAPVARGEGRGATLGDAARAAAASLAAALGGTPADARARGRIKIDVVLARAPIVTRIAPLFALSLVPGEDGIGLDLDGREHLVTTDDLLRADVLAAEQPTAAAEFELGLDGPAVLRRLAEEAGASPSAWRAARKKFFRFRADAFIEPAAPERRGGAPLAVTRGHLEPEKLEADATDQNAVSAATRERWRAAAIDGGRYLLRHLDEKGRFGYEYYTLGDEDLGGAGYSLPRHGGGAYFLAELYGATRDPAFSAGALRALQFLRPYAPPGCDEPTLACVGEPGDARVDLGAAALALAAAVEYQRTTGDRQFLDWARRLANFLRAMQKPDGDFCHFYDPRAARRDERTKLLYFSGEAVFALARFAALAQDGTPADPGDADAVRRGLDHLTGAEYDFFAGQFFFGEDHWTCLAADAAWPLLSDDARRRHARFCDQLAEFLRRTQFTDGDPVLGGQPDFAGAYGFSPLLPPHLTPVGSRSEAMLSTLAMDRRLGESGAATRAQIALGLDFVLARQITDDNAWLMANPEAARGGFLMSDVKRFIRIDFVQHVGSALLRAADLM